MGSKTRQRLTLMPAAPRARRAAAPRMCKRLSERIHELARYDDHIRVVVAGDQPVLCGAALVLVDVGLLDEYVGETEVEAQLLRELVLRATGEPVAVTVRQPHRAIGIVDRRLVVGKAAAQFPLLADLVG